MKITREMVETGELEGKRVLFDGGIWDYISREIIENRWTIVLADATCDHRYIKPLAFVDEAKLVQCTCLQCEEFTAGTYDTPCKRYVAVSA